MMPAMAVITISSGGGKSEAYLHIENFLAPFAANRTDVAAVDRGYRSYKSSFLQKADILYCGGMSENPKAPG